MTGNNLLSPTAGDQISPTAVSFSLNTPTEINMEGSSEFSERFLKEEVSDQDVEGDEAFEFRSNGIEKVGSNGVLAIESSDLMPTAEYVVGMESGDLMNDDEQLVDLERNDDAQVSGQIVVSQGNNYPPPVVGMEFESYDDAYHYYNCHATELGFAIRIKSSWTKRNSNVKRGAVLCCNCEGFKSMKGASCRKKDTRTGCQAMLKLRLLQSSRWRVDVANIEHNHLFDPERAQNSKSHKKLESRAKRYRDPSMDDQVRTIKLYRTSVNDTVGNGSLQEEGDSSNYADKFKHLKFQKGEAEHLSKFFFGLQLANPNFFYVMDLNDEGNVRNVFWIDSRSRTACTYFGDVMAIDTTCLSERYNIPLLVITGVNHHCQSILLGCALIVDESLETYTWLLRAWLSSMRGRPPQTVISDRSKNLESAISEVFPRAHHRLCLPRVMQSILERLGGIGESEVFRTILARTVYNSLRVDEFVRGWEEMVQHFGIKDHEWLQTVFDDKERWAPVYLKDTFFAGLLNFQPGDFTDPFFQGYVKSLTTLKEFLDIYELVLQRKHQKEALDDLESRDYHPALRTQSSYELQMAELYTKEVFLKFQAQLEMMSNCFTVSQIQANGPIITYMVKEREAEGDTSNARSFEVTYDKKGGEVGCICSCFNFRGYLCRHALSVLAYNGVADIPSQYILSRWRKDFKRLYAPEIGSHHVDTVNPLQWFDHLYRRAMQVAEEAMSSSDHYMVALQAFKESLIKVRLVGNDSL